MALNLIAYTETVVQSFLRYQLTAYPFSDQRLHRQMRALLSLDETRRSPLLKGPYISLPRPFREDAAVAALGGGRHSASALGIRRKPRRPKYLGSHPVRCLTILSGTTSAPSSLKARSPTVRR